MQFYSLTEAKERIGIKHKLRAVGVPFSNEDDTELLRAKLLLCVHADTHPWSWCSLSDVPFSLRYTPGVGYEIAPLAAG